MSRKPRKYTIAPGSLYHIVARGNNKKRIFRSVQDRRKFLQILKTTKEQLPFYLYALSLMPNHYHLEVETRDVPISSIMQRVNFLYARYFHHRYGTSGHFFQERFFSNLINKEKYFWNVARYIDVNAVKGGLVKTPEKYKWGSYALYFKGQYDNGLVDCKRFLKYEGDSDVEKNLRAYLEFVRGGLENMEQKPKFPFNKNME